MENETKRQSIDIDGKSYEIVFVKRPFREGLEARIVLAHKTIAVAELGLGEQALIERLRSLIIEELNGNIER